jgi:DNA replication protein DnaC
VQHRGCPVSIQLPVALWHGALGEPTLADAILDRLLHSAHRIDLHGESMRKTQISRSCRLAPTQGQAKPIN